jgi:hypothetical protein
MIPCFGRIGKSFYEHIFLFLPLRRHTAADSRRNKKEPQQSNLRHGSSVN